MILRHLSTALRRQDWVTVLIETLIVVAGVFLGVQLGNWNEAQQHRALYGEALDRVATELRANIDSLERAQAIVDERLPAVQAAIEALQACRADDAARANIEKALVPLGQAIGFDLYTDALDTLIANDDLLQFQDSPTRARLLRLSRSIRRLNTSSEETRTTAQRHGFEASFDQTSTVPGTLTTGSPQDLARAIGEGAIVSTELVRSTDIAVPLSEACRDRSFLRQFYLWELAAYWHGAVGARSEEQFREELTALGFGEEISK